MSEAITLALTDITHRHRHQSNPPLAYFIAQAALSTENPARYVDKMIARAAPGWSTAAHEMRRIWT